VQNTGGFDGDEVVQVYASTKDLTRKTGHPLRSLVAYKRVHLKIGETQSVALMVKIPPGASGPLELSIGGGQPDTHLPMTSTMLKTSIPIP
jgi:beta-glucosidase